MMFIARWLVDQAAIESGNFVEDLKNLWDNPITFMHDAGFKKKKDLNKFYYSSFAVSLHN